MAPKPQVAVVEEGTPQETAYGIGTVCVDGESPPRFPSGTVIRTHDGLPPNQRVGVPAERWEAKLPGNEWEAAVELSMLDKAAVISVAADMEVRVAEAEIATTKAALAKLEAHDQVTVEQVLALENTKRRLRSGERRREWATSASLSAHGELERVRLQVRRQEREALALAVQSETASLVAAALAFKAQLAGLLETHRVSVAKLNKLDAALQRTGGRGSAVLQGAFGSPFDAVNVHRDGVFSAEFQQALRQSLDEREARAGTAARRQRLDEDAMRFEEEQATLLARKAQPRPRLQVAGSEVNPKEN